MLKQIIVTLISAVSISCSNAAYGHEPHAYNHRYIYWGVDEYELFGKTQTELSEQFKNRLVTDWVNAHVWVEERGPREFLLTFRNKRVCEVQRQFTDGGGCKLLGPLLTSKEQALLSCIAGLSQYEKLTAKEKDKLAAAKKMLLELQRTKTRSV